MGLPLVSGYDRNDRSVSMNLTAVLQALSCSRRFFAHFFRWI